MTIVTKVAGNGNCHTNLRAAKTGKNDRFFTQLSDIEKELCHYRKQLKGKTVFVNCDGSVESNFRKHLMMAFDIYGLKRLIVTTFNVDGTPALKYDITDGLDGDYRKLLKVTKPVKLEGDGDFRSDECVTLLKECDVVIGNPPFSLFREYVAQIMEHKKKLIIVGNVNAITYKEIFPLIKANKLWLGPSLSGTNPEFQVPADYQITTKASRIDDEGNKFVKVTGIRWFTNMTHNKRNETLLMYKNYSASDYATYDNYDAINVNKVKEIPVDYDGVIGVPITFLDKFNPNQFEIVGLGVGKGNFVPSKQYADAITVTKKGESSGNVINQQLVIAYAGISELPPKTKSYYTSSSTTDVLVSPYARILIRAK